MYFISIFLDWHLGFEPTLQLKGWNLRALQNETHMRASILNTTLSSDWSLHLLDPTIGPTYPTNLLDRSPRHLSTYLGGQAFMVTITSFKYTTSHLEGCFPAPSQNKKPKLVRQSRQSRHYVHLSLPHTIRRCFLNWDPHMSYSDT